METISNALIGRYIDMFLSLVEGNIKVFINCRTEFESMKTILLRIQDFVKLVDNRGMKTRDHFTNELRELMYDADNITADYSGLTMINRLGIGKKLKDINEKLEKMESKMENFVTAIVASGQQREDVDRRRPADPVNDVARIVGLEKAIIKVKNWVLKEDRDRKPKFNFIGLVGKGGSGKTTLAEMILKDEEINKHFHLLQQKQNDDKKSKHSIKKMLFVTVSQPVDVKIIMKSMLKQLEVPLISGDGDDEREMSTKIHESLKGSRYFLVLDDVWSLDDGWWKTIKNALPEGSENCVLITSRMKNIVRQMGVGEERIHEPEALGEEDGWTLFCKNISADDVSKDDDFKKIGMEIVRKCGGLPLAIKVMGGVVSSHDISTAKWMQIKDKFMEYLSENKNDSVLGSLGLSYDELRLTCLQPCLLCFGVFPEDCVIKKDKVIRWWIGEGFVPTVESAEKCFEELVNRSLIEAVESDYDWKVYSCKLHDLVRELLIRKGKSEAFFEIGENKISRRIVVNDDIRTTYSQISASKAKLRAVVSSYSSEFEVTKEFLEKIYDGCKYLRVLDLADSISKLRDYHILSRFKHLTYLNVGDEYIVEVPDEISKLRSLLVLCLGMHGKTLPDSITKLNQLIWLDVSECPNLIYLPKGLGNVSTLQVIKGFIPSSSTRKGCRFEELRQLTQLVTLELQFESDDQLSDGEVDALSKLDRLQSLTIDCRELDYVNNSDLMKLRLAQKLDNLVLPKFLDEVQLIDYPGDSTPSWLSTENLPRLQYLYFSNGEISHFHENFYKGEKWGIIHLILECLFKLEGDWNVIRGRLPNLKTVRYNNMGLDLRLTGYPTTENGLHFS